MVADLFNHENVGGTFEFCVSAFSRSRDDLGQWRAYADNGRGFALGLAPPLFGIADKADRKPDDNVFVGVVRYGEDAVRAMHLEPLQKALDIVNAARRDHDDTLRDKAVGIPFLGLLANNVMAEPLIWNCLTSKHGAYENEQEVRLIILGMRDRLAPYLRTRTRGSEIVPYIAKELPVRSNITEIVIGPSAPPMAEDSIRALLASVGLSKNAIPIVRSNLPTARFNTLTGPKLLG